MENHKNKTDPADAIFKLFLCFMKIVLVLLTFIAGYLIFNMGSSFLLEGRIQGSALYSHSLGLLGGGLVTLLVLGRQEKIPMEQKGIKNLPGILCVVLFGIGTALIGNFLMSLIPFEAIGGQEALQNNEVMYAPPFVARLVMYGIIAPLAEESLFRYGIYHRCKEGLTVWGALILSSLLFGIYHGNLQQGVYAFFMGILMAGIMELTGNFWMPVLFHGIANVTVNLCFEFEILSKLAFSGPGLGLLGIVTILGGIGILYFYLFLQKENKCSKKD